MPDAKVEQQLGLAPLARTATTGAVRERRYILVRHKLKTAIMRLALRNGIETWDDAGVEAALDRMVRERNERLVGHQTRRPKSDLS